MKSIFDHLFPLGIGTNRFQISSFSDQKGMEAATDLVVYALKAGISYLDVASTYSKGAAAEICRRAIQETGIIPGLTVKSSFLYDSNSDDALRRTEKTFNSLGVDHAAYFVCWNIADWAQFLEITRKDGLYEGALQAKARGLVDHICFSTHAPPEDIIRMLKSGLFEGVTVSFSPMNSQIMFPVLDCAQKMNIGVVVMNPLGGGLIPQQEKYFSFLRHPQDRSTVEAALRFVYAHPAVKIVLSGISSIQELRENMAAFQDEQAEHLRDRIERVRAHFANIEGFCTGCHYCDGCPQNINIFELMQAYNTRLFPHASTSYGRTDPELVADIALCDRLRGTFAFRPQTPKNPCIACGACESHCTAHLPIIQRIRELYQMFNMRCFSQSGMRDRLKELIGTNRRIAFYPGGGYTAFVLSLVNEIFAGQNLELFLFDSSPNVWGNTVAGLEVRNPSELEKLRPDMVLISNYNFGQEIYDQLKPLRDAGIPVVRLHREEDVPWL